MLTKTKRRAFRALVRTDASDLFREKLTVASMLTMVLVLLVIHTALWLAFAVTGSAPRIAQADLAALTASPHTAKIAAQLAPLAAGSQDDPNATLAMSTGASTGNSTGDNANTDAAAVTVTLLDSRVGWDVLWQTLRAAGVPAGSITVIGVDGDPAPDFLRLNLGTEFLAVLASIALIGTTVPLVAARERGMLRLLGTTPLPRRLFLAARIPTRLALLLACTAGIIAIGIARRYTEVSALPRFAVTVSCAAIMLFGLGAVFSARARNAEASQNVMAGLSLALVFSGGAVIPTAVLPAPMRTVVGLLPGSWVTEPASADLAGTTPLLPVPVYWAFMLLTGVACFVLAARRFSWDAAPTPARRRKDPEATAAAPSDAAPSDATAFETTAFNTPQATSREGAIT